MKYRRLAQDELQELEQEFVRFLAANTVTASDWVKLKAESPEKSERLVDMFSDIVWEKILSRVEYLEHRQPKMLRCYRFHDGHVRMMGIAATGEGPLDFTRNDSPQEMVAQLRLSQQEVQLFSGRKEYRKTKEMEIFTLMEEGALISKDPKLFATLLGLSKSDEQEKN